MNIHCFGDPHAEAFLRRAVFCPSAICSALSEGGRAKRKAFCFAIDLPALVPLMNEGAFKFGGARQKTVSTIHPAGWTSYLPMPRQLIATPAPTVFNLAAISSKSRVDRRQTVKAGDDHHIRVRVAGHPHRKFMSDLTARFMCKSEGNNLQARGEIESNSTRMNTRGCNRAVDPLNLYDLTSQ